MKKWLLIGLVVTASLFGGGKIDILNRKGESNFLMAISTCVLSNEEVTCHVHDLFRDLYDLYVEEKADVDRIAAAYPGDPLSQAWKDSFAFLSLFPDRETFALVVPFLFFGFYDSQSIPEGEKEQLLRLQKKIFHSSFEIIQFAIFIDCNDELMGMYCDQVDRKILEKIKNFAENSSDPFFSQILFPLIKNWKNRLNLSWDKFFIDDEDDWDDEETSAKVAFDEMEDEYRERFLETLLKHFLFPEVIDVLQQLG
jgi:hypothetical protein